VGAAVELLTLLRVMRVRSDAGAAQMFMMLAARDPLWYARQAGGPCRAGLLGTCDR